MDWATDLGGFDPMDVRLVCAQWRSGESNRMPTPGELVAKCQKLVKPELMRQMIRPASRPAYSDEHRELMKAEMQTVIARLAERKRLRGPLDRRSGETATQQAERLWPSHRIDRMRT